MFLATAVLPVGFTRKGRPIYPIRGAEDPPTTLEDAIRRMDSLRSDLTRERDRRQSAESREQAARADLDARTRERDEARTQVATVDTRVSEARIQGEQAGKQAADADWSQKLVKQTVELVSTRARQLAIDAGVKPEKEPPKDGPDRVARFLGLIDMQGVADNDGGINAEELSKRVSDAATKNPEFVVVSTAGGSGGRQSYQSSNDSGQGSGGDGAGAANFQSKVDSALANMHRTLRLPAPNNNNAGAAAGT